MGRESCRLAANYKPGFIIDALAGSVLCRAHLYCPEVFRAKIATFYKWARQSLAPPSFRQLSPRWNSFGDGSDSVFGERLIGVAVQPVLTRLC